MDGVFVVKRKLRRPKTGAAFVADAKKYADPSHESEKPKNPLNFRRASYAKAFETKPLWTNLKITSRHISELFGEPTRILHDGVEYVVQLPTREVLRILVGAKGVSVWGFNKTLTVESWVERLVNS